MFERKPLIRISLEPGELKAVNAIAKSKGVDSVALIREWILEKIEVS